MTLPCVLPNWAIREIQCPVLSLYRKKALHALDFLFLSSTTLGGLWLPSQLAAMYFVRVLSLSIYQTSFVLGHPSHLGATSS
jgi:hypothetical protein